ncbi:hypothetical protein [Nocardia sp. NPDC048505]|uniref:hypothetical protein n=1 Tax=unclassified Nocardia TaxID=2637762 RepID=UPI0033C023C5
MTVASSAVLPEYADVLIEGVIGERRENHSPIPRLATPPQRPEIRDDSQPRTPSGLRGAGVPPMRSATPAGVAVRRDARRPREISVHLIRVPEPPERTFRSC